jgi:hypothetical protein
MVINEMQVNVPNTMAGRLAAIDMQESKHKPTGIKRAPTVLTSQTAVFDPVTFMKLSMSTIGHSAVSKM